jgi:hypothetical protein
MEDLTISDIDLSSFKQSKSQPAIQFLPEKINWWQGENGENRYYLRQKAGANSRSKSQFFVYFPEVGRLQKSPQFENHSVEFDDLDGEHQVCLVDGEVVIILNGYNTGSEEGNPGYSKPQLIKKLRSNKDTEREKDLNEERIQKLQSIASDKISE